MPSPTSTRVQKQKYSNADPEEPSALAKKRAALRNTYGSEMVSKDTKLKGSISFETGRLQWWDPDGRAWKDAAFHSDYRPQLIQTDIESNHGYVEIPDSGLDEYDITSPCDFLHQNMWQFDTWENLSRICDEDDNAVMVLEERPKHDIPLGDVQPMTYNGLILLDVDNNPVYDFPGIPKALSSKLEGGRIEALRRVFPFLQVRDLRARSKSPLYFHLDFSLAFRFVPGQRHKQVESPPWPRCELLFAEIKIMNADFLISSASKNHM